MKDPVEKLRAKDEQGSKIPERKAAYPRKNVSHRYRLPAQNTTDVPVGLLVRPFPSGASIMACETLKPWKTVSSKFEITPHGTPYLFGWAKHVGHAVQSRG